MEQGVVLSIGQDVLLRTLGPEDAQTVYETVDRNRDHLHPWMPWVDGTTSVEVTSGVIANWEAQRSQGMDIVLGIFQKGAHIGTIGLHRINPANQSAMIGYWLDGHWQGHGIMTGCARAVTRYAFETLGLNRVYIHCALENEKSRAIAVRLGYVQEGILRQEECLYGAYHDLVVYGMLREEWKARG